MVLGFGASSKPVLGTTGGIISLFVLQGVGRGVWEGTNKGLFAEYFAYDTLGAFSNIIIQNGLASAIVSFISVSGKMAPICDVVLGCPVYAGEAWASIIFSVLAILGFSLASVLNSKGIRTYEQLYSNSNGAELDSETDSTVALLK